MTAAGCFPLGIARRYVRCTLTVNLSVAFGVAVTGAALGWHRVLEATVPGRAVEAQVAIALWAAFAESIVVGWRRIRLRARCLSGRHTIAARETTSGWATERWERCERVGCRRGHWHLVGVDSPPYGPLGPRDRSSCPSSAPTPGAAA